MNRKRKKYNSNDINIEKENNIIELFLYEGYEGNEILYYYYIIIKLSANEVIKLSYQTSTILRLYRPQAVIHFSLPTRSYLCIRWMSTIKYYMLASRVMFQDKKESL